MKKIAPFLSYSVSCKKKHKNAKTNGVYLFLKFSFEKGNNFPIFCSFFFRKSSHIFSLKFFKRHLKLLKFFKNEKWPRKNVTKSTKRGFFIKRKRKIRVIDTGAGYLIKSGERKAKQRRYYEEKEQE